MLRSDTGQRFVGAVMIILLAVFSEAMLVALPNVTQMDYRGLLSVLVPVVGAMTVYALLSINKPRGLRFAPNLWDWALLYLSAAGFCWMAGWRLAQGIGMVVELAPLPCLIGVMVFLMYRPPDNDDEPVMQVVIREVTEEEWNAKADHMGRS